MTPETLLTSLPSIVIALAIALGGLYAFKRAFTRSFGELQERVIATYKSENEAQAIELVRLRHTVTAMRIAFKQMGIEIEINGASITLINGQQRSRKRIIQIPDAEETLES